MTGNHLLKTAEVTRLIATAAARAAARYYRTTPYAYWLGVQGCA
jgi:hypothetical protein